MKSKYKIILVISFLSILYACQKKIIHLQNISETYYPIGIDGKWGYADKNGNIVIDYKFDSVQFFHYGLAAAKWKGEYGYINKLGKWHIKPKYDYAFPFHTVYAKVIKNNFTYFINTHGRKIDPRKVGSYDRGCCQPNLFTPVDWHTVKNEVKYAITKKFNLIKNGQFYKSLTDTTKYVYDAVFPFSKNYIIIKENQQYGFYKIEYERIIIEYDSLYTEEYNKKFIDKSLIYGSILLPYDSIKVYKNICGAHFFATVRKDGLWGIVNWDGVECISPKYLSIIYDKSWNFPMVEYEKGKFGFINLNGKKYFKH